MTMVAMREGKGHCDGCCDRGNNDDHGGSDETDVVCRQVVLQDRSEVLIISHTMAEGCLHQLATNRVYATSLNGKGVNRRHWRSFLGRVNEGI